MNPYHPSDQVKMMVAHGASAQTIETSKTQSCLGGMNRGFVGEQKMREDYQNQTSGTATMNDFVGYINNLDGSVVSKNLTDIEDDYEALAKAIGIYNGAKWRMLNYSWPRMIKYLKYQKNSKANSGSICHSCKYSILVRNHTGVFKNHLRTYVWEGAAAVDINGDGVIGELADDPRTDETDPVNEATAGEEGVSLDVNGDGQITILTDDPRTHEDDPINEEDTRWCFKYGEADWVNPFKVPQRDGSTINATFANYLERARSDATYQIECM